MHRTERGLVRPFNKLQLLVIAVVNNGNSLRVIYLANELNGTSDATEQSADKNLNRNTLVLCSVS